MGISQNFGVKCFEISGKNLTHERPEKSLNILKEDMTLICR